MRNWTCPKCGKTMKAGGTGPHGSVCGRDYTPVFWSKVNKTTTCWLWTGGCTYAGHGQFVISQTARATHTNEKVLVHRHSWTLAFGPIPEGMQVLHKCDVPNCVKPDHLFLGTPKINGGDRSAKGRNANGRGQRSPALPPHKFPRSKNEPRV